MRRVGRKRYYVDHRKDGDLGKLSVLEMFVAQTRVIFGGILDFCRNQMVLKEKKSIYA